MAISYSGGLYTLSSSGSYTPADLYAYSSSGITRLNGSRIIYDFGSSRIIVGSGTTLTIDTDDDYGEIMFSDPGWDGSTYLHHIKVNAGGTLNLGNTYSQDVLMVSKEAYSLSYLDQAREWRIDGTLNWYGGIVVGGNFQLYSGSDGTIEGYATHYKVPGVEGGSLRISEADFVPTKLRLFGGAIVPFVATTNTIKGLTFINCATQPAVGLDNNNTSGAEFMECEDWDVSDSSNTRGFGYWDQRWARYINQATGTDFNTPLGNLADHSNNRGLLEVREGIEFSATSGSGAKFYTKDTNNGSRLAANQIVDNPSYTADRTYTLTESGGTASYDTDGGVLIGVYWRATGGTSVSANNKFDSRGLNNNQTDIFNWMKVEYGQQPANANIVMKGIGGVSTAILSLPDNGITQATKATVAAYTGIALSYSGGLLTATISGTHTLQSLYDYVKYWESENPSAVWTNGKESFAVFSGGKYTFNHFKILFASGGNLTIDDNVDFDSTCSYKTIDLVHGATFTFGSKSLVSGQYVYTNPVMRFFTDSSGEAGSAPQWSPLYTHLNSEGGTWNFVGGRIEGKMNTAFDGDSSGNKCVLNIDNTEFKNTFTSAYRVWRIGGFNNVASSASSIISNCILNSDDTSGYYETEMGAQIPFTVTASFSYDNHSLAHRCDNNAQTFVDFNNSNNRGSHDVGFDAGSGDSTPPKTLIYVNASAGVRYIGRPQVSTNASRMKGYGLSKRRIAPTVKDVSGTGVVGAKVYTKDTDNGNRKNLNLFNDTADKEYTLTSSTGGVCPATDIITEIYNRPSGTTGSGTYDTGLNRIDRRCKGDIQGDETQPLEFDFLIVAYGKTPQTYSDVDLLGLGTLSPVFQAFDDLGITESTKATVAAYAGITPVYSSGTLTVTVSSNHTWAEVYDYIKYYESENPDEVWANGKQSFVATGDGVNFTGHNFELVVNSSYTVTADGVNVVADDGFTISGDFTGLISDGTNYRVPITLTGVADGSRYRIEKTSDGTLIANGTQSGTGDIATYYSITANLGVTAIVRKGSSATKYLPFSSNATATTASGATIVVSQVEDTIA